MKRKQPNLREMLAATLLALRKFDPETGKFDPVIDWQTALLLSPEQIIARFEFDHYPIPVTWGGTNHPSNLVPRLKAEHRTKTAKIDMPAIAKVKRLTKDQEEFRRRMLAKVDPTVEAPPKRRSRIQSRGFQGHRKFNGEIVRK